MRILQLSSARHFGGGERHFVDLTNGLARSGHEVFAATTPDSPLLSELQNLPESNLLRLSFRKPFDVASAWKLRRFAREREIDIVHAHMARDYPLASLAAGRSSPRLVLTRHVLFPMGPLHRLTRRRVARVIAVSEAVAARLRDQKIFDEAQIAVVRHGIDLERFHSVGARNETKMLRVGMLGELSPVKGQKEFVRAAAVVADQRIDVEFIIAGRDNSTEGEYRRELIQSIESAGLTERVRVIESKIDVAEFLSQLDVFVSASSSEAFGLAIAEAMAAG
ncbi:MAG TPA: glycosyltransferase family 4 protein, partial [Pyrinomonadaceae bacterium]